jgi:hypothetical protein
MAVWAFADVTDRKCCQSIGRTRFSIALPTYFERDCNRWDIIGVFPVRDLKIVREGAKNGYNFNSVEVIPVLRCRQTGGIAIWGAE